MREHGPSRLRTSTSSTYAYAAWPGGPGRGAVVLLPDVRGLHPFYEDLARSFALAGFSTMAVDLYGATASDDDRGKGFTWQAHVPHVTGTHVEEVVRAALLHLTQEDDGPSYCVGFCFGGGHAWNLAGSGLGLAAVIGFYGLPGLVTRIATSRQAPSLLLLAEDDEETPTEAFDSLLGSLSAAQAPFQACVLRGTTHSFFDRKAENQGDACALAWRLLLSFTDEHRGPASRSPTPPC